MPVIDLKFVSEGSAPLWPELVSDPNLIHLTDDDIWTVAILEKGMSSGLPSIALRLELPDGKTVVAETSVQAWSAVTIAARARYPEAFADGPLDPVDTKDL